MNSHALHICKLSCVPAIVDVTQYLSVLTSRLHDAEDVDKQVDEVQVEVDGSHDVLLWRQLVHDHVSVKYDKAAEEQGTSNGEDKFYSLTPEEQLHNDVQILPQYQRHPLIAIYDMLHNRSGFLIMVSVILAISYHL